MAASANYINIVSEIDGYCLIRLLSIHLLSYFALITVLQQYVTGCVSYKMDVGRFDYCR